MSIDQTSANSPADLSHAANSAESTDSRRALLLGMGTLAAGAILASSRQAQAGPLNPPVGPVASSGLTLPEIASRIAPPGGITEPRTPISPSFAGPISQPGNYYLTADRAGIAISASDVTLDLNGFTITVAAGLPAITINASRVKILNGRIRPASAAPTDSAIRTALTTGTPSQVKIIDLDITATNYAVDLFLFSEVYVERVTWRSTGSGVAAGGLIVGRSSTIINCSGSGGGAGITTSVRSIVQACRASGSGSSNFILGEASIAIGCVSDGNSTGFGLNAGVSLEACSAQGHSNNGIEATGNARISRCQVSGGTTGINLINGGNRVEQCKIGNAVTSISSNGIDTIVENSMNAQALRFGVGISSAGGDSHIDSNMLYGFSTGIACSGSSAGRSITRNRIFACDTPILPSGFSPLIAPNVNSLATATNPFANIVG
jgi:hypothetical protein